MFLITNDADLMKMQRKRHGLDVPVALHHRGQAAPPGVAANGGVPEGRDRHVTPRDELKLTREAELRNTNGTLLERGSAPLSDEAFRYVSETPTSNQQRLISLSRADTHSAPLSKENPLCPRCCFNSNVLQTEDKDVSRVRTV